MAIGGNREVHLDLRLDSPQSTGDVPPALAAWFAEEVGVIVEVAESELEAIIADCRCHALNAQVIGIAMPKFGAAARVSDNTTRHNQSIMTSFAGQSGVQRRAAGRRAASACAGRVGGDERSSRSLPNDCRQYHAANRVASRD